MPLKISSFTERYGLFAQKLLQPKLELKARFALGETQNKDKTGDKQGGATLDLNDPALLALQQGMSQLKQEKESNA